MVPGPSVLARLSMVTALCAGLVLLPGMAGAQQETLPASPAPARPVEKAPPILAGGGLTIGGGLRLDDSQWLETTQRTGIAVGGHLVVSPSRWFSVGLMYDHSELSREETAFLPAGGASVVRRLDMLWADLRVYVLGREGVAPFVDLAPGLAWQSLHASGIGFSGATTNHPLTFRCDAQAGANLGLRAGLGVEGQVANGIVLSGALVFDNLRLTSDVVDNCAPGAGSAAVLGLRVGLGYRFDASRVVR